MFYTLAIAQSSVWDTPEGRERVFEATVRVFEDNYWNQEYTDWQTWANIFRDDALAATSRKDFDSVMQRMVSHLDDQHSRWLGKLPTNLPAPLLERGLGTEQSYLPGTGLVIENVLPQSPAHEADLKRGDVMVRINSNDLRNSSSHEVIKLLSEAINQNEVSLDIRRKQQRLSIRLKPAELNLSELKNLPQSEMLSSSIGYLYLPSFTQPSTAERFHQHLRELQTQGATKLILDLRDNPGGGLGELGLVMCAFLEGDWLQAIYHNETRWTASCSYHDHSVSNTLSNSKDEILSQDKLEEATFFEGPIVVLVSHSNNSAGEVAVLVLQYMSQAIIIGQKTLGNVEALQEFKLSDESVILVAVANLQGMYGKHFSGGVIPDIEAQRHLSEMARGFDAPLAEALKVIEALPFTPGKYF